MHIFQNRLLYIPFHQLTYHNFIPQELIHYACIEEFSLDVRLLQPTLVTLTHMNDDDYNILQDKDKVLQLVQNPHFVGLILCTNKNIEIEEEIILILSQCDIPVIQVERQSSLLIFEQEEDSLFLYNNLGIELEGATEKGISKLALKLSDMLEVPFLFIDNQYHIEWQSGTPDQLKHAEKWLETNRKELIVSRSLHMDNKLPTMAPYMFFNIHVSHATTYTLITTECLVTWQRRLIDKFIGLLTLFTQTNMRIKDQLEQFKEHFIHNLLHNNFSSRPLLIQQGDALGWDLRKAYHLFIIDIELVDELLTNVSWIEEVKQHFKVHKRNTNEEMIVFQFKDQIIILLAEDKERNPLERKEFALTMAERFQLSAETKWPNCQIKVGIGNYYTKADELHKSYQEAILAIQFMQYWFIDKRVCHINDLGAYRLLLYIPQEVLHEFAKEILSAFIASDETNETEYIKTIQSYFRKQGKLNEVAKELYIHPNTLRNRIKKIEEISGLSMQNPEGCINLNLAIRILTFMSE